MYLSFIKILIVRLKRLIARLFLRKHQEKLLTKQWEYKVVQLIAQSPPNPDDASKKLGGSLSAGSLRTQFPKYYSNTNGRQQISDFLNLLGKEGWELVEVQQIAELPIMILKRPRMLTKDERLAKQKKEW